MVRYFSAKISRRNGLCRIVNGCKATDVGDTGRPFLRFFMPRNDAEPSKTAPV